MAGWKRRDFLVLIGRLGDTGGGKKIHHALKGEPSAMLDLRWSGYWLLFLIGPEIAKQMADLGC